MSGDVYVVRNVRISTDLAFIVMRGVCGELPVRKEIRNWLKN